MQTFSRHFTTVNAHLLDTSATLFAKQTNMQIYYPIHAPLFEYIDDCMLSHVIFSVLWEDACMSYEEEDTC